MNDRQVRVGLCDERPPGTRRLWSMLSSIDNVKVVGMARGGPQTLTMIETIRPDLVLLDVDLPGLDGLKTIERVTQSAAAAEAPLFAVLAESRKLAARAFDSGAIDFLQKPVRLARLEKTCRRARQRLSWREAERSLDQLLDRRSPGSAGARSGGHVWVNCKGEVLRVDLDRLARVSAEGPHVRLHLDGSSFLLREGIGSVEARLNPRMFARVHRSHAVRLDQVIGWERSPRGGWTLLLRDGDRIPLGRKYSGLVRRHLSIQGRGTQPPADQSTRPASPNGRQAAGRNIRAADPARHGEQP